MVEANFSIFEAFHIDETMATVSFNYAEQRRKLAKKIGLGRKSGRKKK